MAKKKTADVQEETTKKVVTPPADVNDFDDPYAGRQAEAPKDVTDVDDPYAGKVQPVATTASPADVTDVDDPYSGNARTISTNPAPVVQPGIVSAGPNDVTDIDDPYNGAALTVNPDSATAHDTAADTPDPLREAIQSAGEAQRKYFADYLQEEKDRYERERAEAQEQIRADQQAGRWAGLTELAASVANLVGVGEGNAVSQQYKNYSQDWMRKADEDMRYHRSRIDNLRDRQRAIQQRMLEVEQNNNLRLVDYEMKKRQQEQAARQAQAKLQLDAAKAEADRQYKAGLLSARQYEAETKRAVAEDNAQVKQRELGIKSGVAASQIRANDARAAKYNADAARGGSGSGSRASGNSYEITIDGKSEVINMSTETFKQAMLRGKNEIKKDVMAAAGFNGTWEEFTELANGGKKIKDANGNKVNNPYYGKAGEIVDALNGTGDAKADNEAIERWAQDNAATANNLNKYLKRVSSGASGGSASGAAAANGSKEKKEESIDEEFGVKNE